MIKKFFGNKNFYKMVLLIALPIMLQNFITNFVNMLDNIMVGALGTEEMTGVSIVNQLIFIFNLTIFGAISGAGIFTAQFFGKKDDDGIRYTLRFKVIIAAIICAAALVIFLTMGDTLINLYLHDGSYDCDLEATFAHAKTYLAIILVGLIPYAVVQVYASTLRETGQTLMPMLFGFAAVLVNCLFNYLLIFGKFGFPQLGVAGAAAATVLSRFVECAVTLIYVWIKKERYAYFKQALASLYIPGPLLLDIIKKGLPLLVNECLWSGGMSLLSMTYSYHGLAVMAGYSISSTVINLFNIAFMAFGTSVGIIVGKQLGAGEEEEAVDTVRKLITFSILISIFVGAITFAVGDLIPELYQTTAESKMYAAYFIRVCACFMPVVGFAHAAYFTLRSGGKTIVTFFFDSVYIMVIVVPTAFALYYFFHQSIWVIFPVIQAMDILKCVVGLILIKKRVWVNNIVGEAA